MYLLKKNFAGNFAVFLELCMGGSIYWQPFSGHTGCPPKDNMKVKQSPLDDDTEKKLTA